MKRLLAIFILSFVCMMSTKADVKFIGNDTSRPLLPDTTTTITYVDNFSMKNVGESKKLAKPIKSRAERTSPHAAKIFIEATEVPIEIVECAEIAAGIWENIIDTDVVFKISLEFDTITSDMSTMVGYYLKNNLIYPKALERINSDNIKPTDIAPAGIITINRLTDWDYSTDGNVDSSKKNITYCLMRAVGRIMGFGSSIKWTKNGYVFSNKSKHSIFDTFVKSYDGIPLTSIIPNKGKEKESLGKYINNGPHYVCNKKDSYSTPRFSTGG